MTTLATEYDQCALDPPYELEDYAHELRTIRGRYAGPVYDFDGIAFGVAIDIEPEES